MNDIDVLLSKITDIEHNSHTPEFTGLLNAVREKNKILNFDYFRQKNCSGSTPQYEWQNYINLVEEYYHKKRVSTMNAIASFNHELVESEKQSEMKKYTDYLKTARNFLANPNDVYNAERYGNKPSISEEELLENFSKQGNEATVVTYRAALNSSIDNQSRTLEDLANTKDNNGSYDKISTKQTKETVEIALDLLDRINGMSDDEYKKYVIMDMQPTEEELAQINMNMGTKGR